MGQGTLVPCIRLGCSRAWADEISSGAVEPGSKLLVYWNIRQVGNMVLRQWLVGW
jgi:hypothetical protein